MMLGSGLTIASMESSSKRLAAVGSSANSLISQGNMLFLQKKYAEAFPYLIKAYELSGSQNNAFVHVTAASLLGSIYAEGLAVQQNFDQALKYLNEASNLAKNNPVFGLLSTGIKPVKDKLLAVMFVQAVEKNNSQQYPEALELFTKVYDNSLNDPSLHARAAQALAALYMIGSGVEENIDKALNLSMEAYKLSRKIPDLQDVYAKSAFQLGLHRQDNKDYTGSLPYYRESYNASENIPYYRGLVSLNIGRVYIELNEYLHAEKYLKEAYQIGKKNDYKDIIAAAASGLGKLSSDQKDYAKAVLYFFDAYHTSVNDPHEHASAAANIGMIYSEIGEPENAIKYLNEADALSKQYDYEDIGDTVANAFGVLYTNNKGIEQNDDEAIKYYEKAYQSKDLAIRALAAHNLGRRYLYSRTKRNFDKARKYLEEAATSVDNPLYMREIAIQDLYAMKQMLLMGVDNLIAKIEDGMPSQSTEQLHPLLKQASRILRNVQQISISLGSGNDLQLRNMIAEKWAQWRKIRDEMRAQRRKERGIHVQAPAEEELLQPSVVADAGVALLEQAEKALSGNQLDIAETRLKDFRKMGSKNIDLRKKFREFEKIYAQQKLPTILTTFDAELASYLAKPDNDIFEKADNLLNNATELATFLDGNSNDTFFQISRKREELYKKRSEAKLVTSSREEEKKMSSSASSSSCAVSAVACESTEEHKGPIMAHSAKRVKKFLEQQGFEEARVTGSHHHYRHADGRGTTLAYHNEGEGLSPSSITNLARQIEWDPQALNDALLSMK